MPSLRSAVQIKRQTSRRSLLATRILLASALALAMPTAVSAQSGTATPAASVTYPLVANLTLNADVVLVATIRKLERLSAKEAPGLSEGYNRFVIRANVTGVLLAPRAIPGEITYIWDAPESVYGKRPKLKEETVLLFLRSVPGNDRIYQLVARNAQVLNPSPAIQMVRDVAADPNRATGFGLRVTGVVDATRMQRRSDEDFATHFLIQTAEKGMMTVSVPDTATGAGSIQVAMPDSLGETRPLERNSLVGYFLACGLPDSLPERVLETAAAIGDEAAVKTGYQRLRDTVGPCQ
ncbi:hypothetical protein [Pedomonas mirosovicensis]|uniref:hypothetical protein n=1 Tax=Pedomonas mirosovicensis TaxID=2908641 RepID=UPI0021679805|nr:hypothetical protein [Pedomonas mirosovicensis]MCH8684695.1 hypothetical protein [Pedomonas mirosovicensis]